DEFRALEAGFQQHLLSRFVLVANYFNNLFHDQIEFVPVSQNSFVGTYVNLQKSLAHGAEVELQTRVTKRLSWNSSYTYTSTQILLAPAGSFPPNAQGDPPPPPPPPLRHLIAYLPGRALGWNSRRQLCWPTPRHRL